MASPLTTLRNRYFDNKKSNDIKTPFFICEFLCELLYPYLDKKKLIIDVGCGDGRLSQGFKHWTVLGIDIKKSRKLKLKNFFKLDFLKMNVTCLPSMGDYNCLLNPALVIFNPPFNNKSTGKKLIPELWIRKTFEIWGDKVPLVSFVPMGFRLNQRTYSKRWKYFRDDCKANITSIVSLPLNVFPNVEFHAEILIWNLPRLKAHYWLSKEYLE